MSSHFSYFAVVRIRRFLSMVLICFSFFVVSFAKADDWQPSNGGQYYASAQECNDLLDQNLLSCQVNYSGLPGYEVYPKKQFFLPGYGQNTLYFAGCLVPQLGADEHFVVSCYYPPTVPPAPPTGPAGPPQCTSGSTIRVDELSVGEEVRLVGTPFRLVYTSERVIGHSNSYKINLGKNPATYASGDSTTYNLSYGNGRIATDTVYGPNNSSIFTWDGKDLSGNFMEGPTPLIKETISSTSPLNDIRTFSVGTWNVLAVGLGGWNIDFHHLYDFGGQKIYMGDGSVRPAIAKFDGSQYYVVSENGNELYYFNSSGKHLTTNNSLSNAVVYTFNYDLNGRLSNIVDVYGNTTSILRNGSGVLTGIQSPYGQVTSLSIGVDGYLASIQNPNGEQHSMTYYTGGLLHTFQQPRGQVSTMAYDMNGDLASDASSAGNYINFLLSITGDTKNIQMTNALGEVSTNSRTYNADGFDRTELSASGNSTSINYSQDNKARGNYPVYSSTTYQDDLRFGSALKIPYTSNYQIYTAGVNNAVTFSQSIVNTSTTTTPFNYDSIVNNTLKNWKLYVSTYTKATGVTVLQTPLNRMSSYTTDSLGKITNTKFANFLPVQYSYDTRGRLQFINQGTRQTEFQYDTSGNILSVKNPLLQTTSFTYDLAGRVQTKTLPDSRVISFAYDANGNNTSITPSGTSAHTFTFNPFDLQSVYTAPTVPTSTPATYYSYNNAKRITQITKPDLSTVVFTYSPTTTLLTSIVASGDTTSVTLEPNGNLSAAISQDGISTSQNIGGELLISSSTVNSASLSIGSLAYTYNNDLLPTNLTITSASGSSSVNYTYDNDNIMKTAGSLVISLDGTTGIPTKTTLNKIQEIYSFDSSYGEPVSIQAKYVNGATTTPLFSQSYTRDALGRIITRSETVGTTTNQFAYTYDTASRLTNVTKNSAAYSSYTLSDNNNATSGSVGGTAFTATYDAQDRILTYNTNTYTHTLNGEMKSKTVGGVTTNYTYNGFGMLKTAKVGSGAVITYLYDGLNRRIGRKSGSTVQKYWVYQDQLRIGAELNSSGTITKKFIYGTKVNVPDYMIIGSTTYKIVSDHLGSVRLVVNAATGAISQTMEYNERGEVLVDTSPGFQPFGFAGGVYESDLKLVHFGARTYDPSIGRWLSKDPTLFNGGTPNLYEYAFSDPMSYIDQDGKHPVLIGLGAGFLIGAASSAYIQNKLHPNGSRRDLIKAAFEGGLLTATSVGIGMLPFTGPLVAGGLTATGFGFNFLTAPGDAGVDLQDLSNGVNKIKSPQQNQCPSSP